MVELKYGVKKFKKMTKTEKKALVKVINDFLNQESQMDKEMGTAYTLGYARGTLKFIKDMLE